jgi:heterodisulfide reductase subunit C
MIVLFLPQILFTACLLLAVFLFAHKASKILRNIKLGTPIARNDNKLERIKMLVLVALGQSKMVKRPLAGFLHILVYLGFVLINIEMLEIVLDGILGTHRVFAPILGNAYFYLIGIFEVLALLVLLACVVFFMRRNLAHIKRLSMKEIAGFPKNDANFILIAEIALMLAFLVMNATDGIVNGEKFWVSQYMQGMFSSLSLDSLHLVERFCWWFHILGVLAFLNYLPYSKHLHIMLAFPATYFGNLEPKGKFENLASITREVKIMLDPSADPYAATPSEEIVHFGAKDVTELNQKNLLDAYSCTECGRCTAMCPANQTGKLLSPRKIMMATRDRLEEVGKNIDQNKGIKIEDGKSLVGDYITNEELWACTSCNACTEACPINLDPLSIIMQARQHLAMEASQVPSAWLSMFNNIENNGSPWAFSPEDRIKWQQEDGK